jgi:hypothetical protein
MAIIANPFEELVVMQPYRGLVMMNPYEGMALGRKMAIIANPYESDTREAMKKHWSIDSTAPEYQAGMAGA